MINRKIIFILVLVLLKDIEGVENCRVYFIKEGFKGYCYIYWEVNKIKLL